MSIKNISLKNFLSDSLTDIPTEVFFFKKNFFLEKNTSLGMNNQYDAACTNYPLLLENIPFTITYGINSVELSTPFFYKTVYAEYIKNQHIFFVLLSYYRYFLYNINSIKPIDITISIYLFKFNTDKLSSYSENFFEINNLIKKLNYDFSQVQDFVKLNCYGGNHTIYQTLLTNQYIIDSIYQNYKLDSFLLKTLDIASLNILDRYMSIVEYALPIIKVTFTINFSNSIGVKLFTKNHWDHNDLQFYNSYIDNKYKQIF